MKKQNKQIFNPLSGGFDTIQVTDATKDTDLLFQLTADESLTDWTHDGFFVISKVDPLQGDASYAITMITGQKATHKGFPVDPVFRGRTLALSFNYLMLAGTEKVSLLDQNDALIGSEFNVPAANGREKFATTIFIPESVTEVKFRTESTSTVEGGSFKFDNVQLSADLLKSVDIENITASTLLGDIQSGWTYNLISGDTDNPLYRIEVVGDEFRVVFKKDCNAYINSSFCKIGAENYVYVNSEFRGLITFGRNYIVESGAYDTQTSSISSAISPSAGEVYKLSYLNHSAGSLTNSTIQILATARTKSIVAPTDQVTERSIAFRFRAPADGITEANLSTAGRIGDYVTYIGETAASSVLTQCTTRPSQSDADMSANGILLYTRANHASNTNPDIPNRVLVKIAEPGQLSADNIIAYKDAARKTFVSLSSMINETGTIQWGTSKCRFNPATGVLEVNLAVPQLGVNNTWYLASSDGSDTNTSAYFTFTASKLAQGVAIPTRKPYARYVNNSGQSLPNATATTITNWTKIADTHDFMNPATGVITIPENGVYLITANFRMDEGLFSGRWVMGSSLTNNTSEEIELSGTVSVLQVSPAGFIVITTALSGTVPLTKGTKLRLVVYQGSEDPHSLSAVSPGTVNNDNSFSIVRIGDI